MAGFLAQQIVHGEACYDTWVLDPRRFTGHGTAELTMLKAIEEYQNEFRFHFPHEHRPAGRPIKSTPLTAVLEAEGRRDGCGERLGAGGLYPTQARFRRDAQLSASTRSNRWWRAKCMRCIAGSA